MTTMQTLIASVTASATARPGRRGRRLQLAKPIAAAMALLISQATSTAATLIGMGPTPLPDFTVTSLSNSGLAYGLAGGLLTPLSIPGYEFAYAWNAGVYQPLVDTQLAGGVSAVSANGTVVGWAGSAFSGRAAIWSGNQATILGPAGASASFATAVSADGVVIAGLALSNFGAPSAFVAGPVPGSASIYQGLPPFTPWSIAAGGNAVLGQQIAFFGGAGGAAGLVSPVRGHAAPSLAIPGLPTMQGSAALAASDPIFSGFDPNSNNGFDYGLAVAGYGQWGGGQQAFVLQKNSGDAGTLSWLGMLSGDTYSLATAISADGNLVLGTSGGSNGASRAFYWTAGTGVMQDLDTVLKGLGANLAGWQLQSVTALSANGNYVAGRGLHNGQAETWVADLTPAPVARRLSMAPQSALVDFDSASSWVDSLGAPLASPPGKLDSFILNTGAALLRVSVRLGTQSAADSVEFQRGIFTIEKLPNSSLTVTETLNVGSYLGIPGWGTISAKTLIVNNSATPTADGPALLQVGDRLAHTGPNLLLQTAVIMKDGRLVQYETSSVKVENTLTVNGRYESFARVDYLDGHASLEAGRIEVLANCNPMNQCSTPGTFIAGGPVFARSIVNSGNFIVRGQAGGGAGEGVTVGAGALAGAPASDPLDAFLNKGTLTIYAGSPWAGNVTNDKVGTIKTYGETANHKVDWGAGTFTNNGAYVSDPAVNVFGTLVVGEDGYLTGGAEDAFQVRGNFTSSSHSALWDVGRSTLSFLGAGLHTYSASGSTSWGGLELGPDVKLALKAQGGGPVSFSFAALSGFTSLADLQDRFSADSGITIQVASIQGGWATAGTITLPGGGVLISAVPEPPALWMALAGLLVGCRLKRQRSAL